MYNLISFFCSYFVLILLNLPVSNLTNKNLSPCTNKYFLTKSDDQSTESNGLLYKDIDEQSAKKVKFFEYIGDLKHLDRSGWVMNKIPKPETVAAHMYRMSLIALTLDENQLKKDYGSEFDLNKVIKMTLIHDMAETITGDYTPYDKIDPEKKKEQEIEAIKYLSSYLPENQGKIINNLFDEYEERQSNESKVTKEIDRLDLIIQAFSYEKSQFKNTGKVPDFEEFFDFNFVLSKIRDEQLKQIVASVMKQRSLFLKSVCNSLSNE